MLRQTLPGVRNNNSTGRVIRRTTIRRSGGSSGHHHGEGQSGGGTTIIINNYGGANGGGPRPGGHMPAFGSGFGHNPFGGIQGVGGYESLLLADGFPGSQGFNYGYPRMLSQPGLYGSGFGNSFHGGGRFGRPFPTSSFGGGGLMGLGFDGGLTGNGALNGVLGTVGGAAASNKFGGSAIGGGGGAAIGSIFGDNAQESAVIGGLAGAGLDLASQVFNNRGESSAESPFGFKGALDKTDFGSVLASGVGGLMGGLTQPKGRRF